MTLVLRLFPLHCFVSTQQNAFKASSCFILVCTVFLQAMSRLNQMTLIFVLVRTESSGFIFCFGLYK